MIPKPSKDKFTFIFHRENAAPKYFEISRRRLINYLIAIPTGFTLLFIAIIILAFFLKGNNEIYIPKTIQTNPTVKKISNDDLEKIRKEKEELEGKFQELQATNQELVTKLSTNSGKINPPLQELSLFTILPDQRDISITPVIGINELKITQENDEINFRANLLNKSDNPKVSGHLFIIMKAENAVWLYPSDAFPKERMTINYNSGETVLFARLRIVDAKFPIPPKGSKAFFKVLLFSRTGDLVHKEVFPYEVK